MSSSYARQSGSSSGSGSGVGPIRSLKRTFSSGGTTTTLGVGASIAKKALPASAYDFDFDDEEEDDFMDLDLASRSTTTMTKSMVAAITKPQTNPYRPVASASASTSTSTSGSRSSTSSSTTAISATTSNATSVRTAATTSSRSGATAPLSPSRPANKLVSHGQSDALPLPLATQLVNIPALPRMMPASKENSTDDRPVIKARSSNKEPPPGWIQPVKPPTMMSKGSMQAPFAAGGSASKPGSKGQTSLSSFVVKSDASHDESFASTSSSSLGKKRDLYDTLSAPSSGSGNGLGRPAKVARKVSEEPPVAGTSSSSGTSKPKGKSGSLNIKQQIVLSGEQQKILKMVVQEGKNVFFTGSAGTGKSILLREIIASLRLKYAKKGADRVAITGTTGMAAANIGGTTIHSFAGIGLGQGTGEQLIDNIRKNRKAAGRWLRTEVLIIDEVSMLDGDLFDKLAHIARRFRKKENKPFGGIQLIMTGDFFQLPPVTKSGQPTFAFEAKSWGECIDATVNLTKVFRQRDTEFIDMLNEMRFGELSRDSISKFIKLKREPKYTDGIEPTELFPLRDQVDNANRARLKALPGETYTYTSLDEGEEPFDRMQKTLDNVMAPRVLTLKLNAQVMLLKNMDVGLVNGSVGKVIGFKSMDELDEEDGFEGGSGFGASRAEMDDFNAKIAAMRNKFSADRGDSPGAAGSDAGSTGGGKKPVVPAAKAKSAASLEKCPIVAWKMPDGSIIRMRMQREEFKVEDVGDKVKARRKQFPMICAWAMSIHKSQGQTLERVKCDLSKIFEKGQAYVALSRATSLDGLQVIGFNDKKVLAHPKVVAWTKTLTTLD